MFVAAKHVPIFTESKSTHSKLNSIASALQAHIQDQRLVVTGHREMEKESLQFVSVSNVSFT